MCYIKEYIIESTKSYPRWIGTEMEGYPYLTPKKKGDLGELIVQTKMREYGHIVLPSTKGYNGTDDRLISGWVTEIKLSRAQEKDDVFMINHIKTKIEWERFIFYGWNLIKPHRFVWCTKEDMEKCWEVTSWWSPQAGPDDVMCSGGNVLKWIDSPYTRDMETWDDEPKLYTGLEGFMNGLIQTT